MLVENYKELLSAIFNSDTLNKKVKSVICVYDTKNYEQLVAVFTTSQMCADFFNTSRRNIDCDVCRKVLKADRYRLERVEL